MRIKKKLLLGVLFSALAGLTTVSAQSTYVRIGTGYAFKGATTTFPEVTATSVKANNISLGRGFNSQLAAGHLFSDHFGFELGVGYLKGAQTNLGEIAEFGGDAKSRANMFGIMPSLVVRGAGEKVVPYARLGFIAEFNKVFIETEGEMTDPEFGTVNTEAEFELTGGLGTGFTAALGGSLALSEKLGFYLEANLQQMAWAPKKGELTKLYVDNQSVITFIDASDREIEFVEEISTTGEPNPDQPNQQLRFKLPMSNIGFNIGLMYTF